MSQIDNLSTEAASEALRQANGNVDQAAETIKRQRLETNSDSKKDNSTNPTSFETQPNKMNPSSTNNIISDEEIARFMFGEQMETANVSHTNNTSRSSSTTATRKVSVNHAVISDMRTFDASYDNKDYNMPNDKRKRDHDYDTHNDAYSQTTKQSKLSLKIKGYNNTNYHPAVQEYRDRRGRIITPRSSRKQTTTEKLTIKLHAIEQVNNDIQAITQEIQRLQNNTSTSSSSTSSTSSSTSSTSSNSTSSLTATQTMLTELHQEHSKLQHDIDHLQAILTQATKHSIFVLGLPEELWDYQILPFFDIVEVTTQFRLTSQNLFGKYWNLFVASNQIRVPQDIRDINNLTSIVALLKQQRQYTIAQPLVITLSSKIKHTIDYRSIPIESCMTVTGDGATCESTIVANGGFHLVGNNVKIQNLSLIGDGSCDYSNYAGIFGCQSFVIENVSVQNYMHGIVVEVDRDVCTCDYHSFCDGESCNERSLPGIETSVLESEIQQALSLTPKQVAGLQPESLKEYMTAIRSSLSPIPIAEPVTLVNEDDDSEDDEDFDPTELEEVEPPSETLCNNTIVNKVVAYTYERPTMICNNVQVRHCLVSGITVRGNQAAFNGNGAVLTLMGANTAIASDKEWKHFGICCEHPMANISIVAPLTANQIFLSDMKTSRLKYWGAKYKFGDNHRNHHLCCDLVNSKGSGQIIEIVKREDGTGNDSLAVVSKIVYESRRGEQEEQLQQQHVLQQHMQQQQQLIQQQQQQLQPHQLPQLTLLMQQQQQIQQLQEQQEE